MVIEVVFSQRGSIFGGRGRRRVPGCGEEPVHRGHNWVSLWVMVDEVCRSSDSNLGGAISFLALIVIVPALAVTSDGLASLLNFACSLPLSRFEAIPSLTL